MLYGNLFTIYYYYLYLPLRTIPHLQWCRENNKYNKEGQSLCTKILGNKEEQLTQSNSHEQVQLSAITIQGNQV